MIDFLEKLSHEYERIGTTADLAGTLNELYKIPDVNPQTYINFKIKQYNSTEAEAVDLSNDAVTTETETINGVEDNVMNASGLIGEGRDEI